MGYEMINCIRSNRGVDKLLLEHQYRQINLRDVNCACYNYKCHDGGNKDFRCTRDGACNPCMAVKSSRFKNY